jgi:ribonuclease HII
MPPTFRDELALVTNGAQTIAGVDEVGRGCWAGPVMAAAVVFLPSVYEKPELLNGIDDSKKLGQRQREHLVESMQPYIRSVAVGWVSAHDIDCMGIMIATRTAMQQAIFGLSVVVDALLVDAVSFQAWNIAQHNLIHGDARSLSIAAASIIAKVARDRVMRQYDGASPHYGYAAHKGYGTASHQAALRRYGPSSQHRHSYAPIRCFHMSGGWGSAHTDAQPS